MQVCGSMPMVLNQIPDIVFVMIKTFKASLYSLEKHFIFNNVLLMNRRLALKVFIIDKETSGLVIIKNKSLVL